MEIKLTFEEVYNILSENIKRKTGNNTISEIEFFTIEHEGAKIVERPWEGRFSGIKIKLTNT